MLSTALVGNLPTYRTAPFWSLTTIPGRDVLETLRAAIAFCADGEGSEASNIRTVWPAALYLFQSPTLDKIVDMSTGRFLASASTIAIDTGPLTDGTTGTTGVGLTGTGGLGGG